MSQHLQCHEESTVLCELVGVCGCTEICMVSSSCKCKTLVLTLRLSRQPDTAVVITIKWDQWRPLKENGKSSAPVQAGAKQIKFGLLLSRLNSVSPLAWHLNAAAFSEPAMLKFAGKVTYKIYGRHRASSRAMISCSTDFQDSKHLRMPQVTAGSTDDSPSFTEEGEMPWIVGGKYCSAEPDVQLR